MAGIPGVDEATSAISGGGGGGGASPWLQGGAVGVQVLGGIAQYYQSQKAAKANQSELDSIKDAFDAIKPPDYDVTVQDPPNFIMTKVPEASIDFSKLTPQQFQVVGKFSPQAAAYVAEKNPALVNKSADAQAGRSAQMNALQKYRDIANAGGVDPVMQQQIDAANKASQINAQSRSASTLQDANRRGQLGSGAMLAAQLQGNSDSMQQAANSSQGAAADAYKNRLQALASGAQLGGQVGQQEQQAATTNADIINQFNNRTSQNANAYGQYAAGLQNNAQAQNLNAAQNISNQNVQQNNDTAKYNQAYGNQMQQQQYQNRVAAQGTQNQLIGQQANWTNAQRQQLNNLRSQQYGNQLQKFQGQSGLANQQMGQNNQRAIDTNNAIQGGTNIVSGAMQGKANQDFQADQNQKNRDAYGYGNGGY